jgi:type II secretion system protein G
LRAGFTLAELLAVVAILAILAGVAIPAYMSIVGQQKVKVATTECKHLAGSLKNFAMAHSDDTTLNQGLPDPSSGFQALIADGILERIPIDPWGAPYYWSVVQNPNSGTLVPVVYSNGSGKEISSLD